MIFDLRLCGADKFQIMQRITRMWHGLLWNYRNANNQNEINRNHAVMEQYNISVISDYLGSSQRSQRLLDYNNLGESFDVFAFTNMGDAPGERLKAQTDVLLHLTTMGREDALDLHLEINAPVQRSGSEEDWHHNDHLLLIDDDGLHVRVSRGHPAFRSRRYKNPSINPDDSTNYTHIQQNI